MTSESTIQLRTFNNESFDSYTKRLKNYAAQIKQLSKGKFSHSSTAIDMGEICLIKAHSNTAYQSSGWVPDCSMFCFPLDDRSFYSANSILGNNSIGVSSGNCPYKVIFPEDFTHITVRINNTALSKYLSDEQKQHFFDSINSLTKNLSGLESAKMAGKYIHALFVALSLNHQNHTLQNVSTDSYSKEIINYLYSFITSNRTGKAAPHSNYVKIVRRGMDYIDRNQSRSICLEDMSAKIYASKRSIQYAFSNLLAMTPLALYRANRFNLIRDKLLAATPEQNSVSNILDEFLITNKTRFNREYASFFQEETKHTLLRSSPTNK